MGNGLFLDHLSNYLAARTTLSLQQGLALLSRSDDFLTKLLVSYIWIVLRIEKQNVNKCN